MILELVCVVAKEFSPMDLLEKLPETIIVLTVLVLQRGLEPRPLGRAPPESCPCGIVSAGAELRISGPKPPASA